YRMHASGLPSAWCHAASGHTIDFNSVTGNSSKLLCWQLSKNFSATETLNAYINILIKYNARVFSRFESMPHTTARIATTLLLKCCQNSDCDARRTKQFRTAALVWEK